MNDRERGTEHKERKKNVALREKRAADSRGGGEIRSIDGGGKRRSLLRLRSTLRKPSWPGQEREAGSITTDGPWGIREHPIYWDGP